MLGCSSLFVFHATPTTIFMFLVSHTCYACCCCLLSSSYCRAQLSADLLATQETHEGVLEDMAYQVRRHCVSQGLPES